MRRRAFLAVLSAAATWPLAGRAKPPFRIGFIFPGSRQPNVTRDGLVQGLVDRGYVLGRNLVFEERYAEGQMERVPALVADILALSPDALVTVASKVTLAAHAATQTLPIVCVTGDPVGLGLARSLAHPSGNVTGLSLLTPEFAPKWIELLKAAVPEARRLAFLCEPGNLGVEEEARRLDDAAPRLGVTVVRLSALARDYETTVAALSPGAFDGLIVADSPVNDYRLQAIIARADLSRLPAIYGFSNAASEGGLMSYSANFFEIWRRAAGYVDRILKGANPGDLPIEQATEISLKINLKTAKALGLEISPTMLAAADEVIE